MSLGNSPAPLDSTWSMASPECTRCFDVIEIDECDEDTPSLCTRCANLLAREANREIRRQQE